MSRIFARHRRDATRRNAELTNDALTVTVTVTVTAYTCWLFLATSRLDDLPSPSWSRLCLGYTISKRYNAPFESYFAPKLGSTAQSATSSPFLMVLHFRFNQHRLQFGGTRLRGSSIRVIIRVSAKNSNFPSSLRY